MVKMFRNCFLATKVSFCNEMYEFCQKKNIDYSNVINVAAKDDRITMSHTMVPGHDGARGFGGTCFPKDMSSLNYEMNQVMNSYIIKSAIERNNTIDRVEQDWLLDKGRASV
jgi:UDP-glucose 6-dehydrogenase